MHDESSRRHADLPRHAELGRTCQVADPDRIDVVADDHGRVAAEFHDRGLHFLRGKLREVLAHGNRAGEGDHADDRRGDQVRRDLGRVAEHQVQHPRRQAGIGETLDIGAGRARCFFCCLDDDRTAGGNPRRHPTP
jgi:hypothetical protein